MYNMRLTQSNTILKQFELTRYLILIRCLFFLDSLEQFIITIRQIDN